MSKLAFPTAFGALGMVWGLAMACSSNSATTPSTGVSSCTTLAGCCASLGAGSTSCEETVVAGVSSGCMESLAVYTAGGECGAKAPPASTGCAGLATCCAAMTGSAATVCEQVVTEGVTSACQAELTSYTTTGLCAVEGPGKDTSCTELAGCCAVMSGASKATCEGVVTSGVSGTCSAELSVFTSAGECSSSSGFGSSGFGSSGFGSSGFGSSGFGSSGFGSSGFTSSGFGGSSGFTSSSFGSGFTSSSFGGSSTGFSTQSSSAPPSTCFPHALPVGYKPRPIAVATGNCTAAEDTDLSSCFTSATPPADCSTEESTTGCGNGCVITQETSNTWGAVVIVVAAGSAAVPLTFLNNGGCIQKVDPSAQGVACVNSIQALFQCEITACLAYCPVTSQSDTVGLTALQGSGTTMGCLQNADTTICATYVSAENSACTTDLASGGAADKCNTLVDSTTGLAPYFGLFCGGEDAGI